MKQDEIKKQYACGDLAAKVLEHRHLTSKQLDDLFDGDDFLHDNHAECINAACICLNKAKNEKKKVLIAGDYDCDGICATAIMKDTLDRYGIESGFYIPNRFKEGYGLSVNTVNLAYQKGYSLIVTVDNGIAAEDAIRRCNELGIEIMVTDHHAQQKTLNWDLLVHPDLMEEQFHGMCGAGVALQISKALLGEVKEHVMLAAIATIGDMMDVFYENRCIIKRGLACLNERSFAAVERLLERQISVWDEKEIAFQVVPKMNAIGRLADLVNANNVVRYLLAKERGVIEDGARQIKEMNVQRRKLSKSMSDLALGMMEDAPFVCVVHDDFHEGMLGLVANTITTTLHKPSVVFCRTETTYKGSARGWGDLNLFDFFDDLKDVIVQYGGHAQAAGIQVLPEHMEEFQRRLKEKGERMTITEQPSDDIVISSVDCSIDNIEELERLKPFGHGFDAPVFEIREIHVQSTQVLKNQYPKWVLMHPGCALEAISFSLPKDSVEKKIESMSGTLSINQFMSTKKAQIHVNSFKEIENS